MSSRSVWRGGQACVQVFFIRANQNWGNKDYYPRVGPDIEAPEVLEAFIGQFYDQKDPPRQLILSHPVENPDLVADALSQKLGRKVEILVPQRGEKAELVEGALRNARESLGRQMAEGQAQAKLLRGLAEAFDLDAPPPPDRGLRQLPHPGHQRGGRDDRVRAGRVHEIPVPQVQHPR